MVANALKRFLRELDDGLFLLDQYNEWIQAAGALNICCLATAGVVMFVLQVFISTLLSVLRQLFS